MEWLVAQEIWRRASLEGSQSGSNRFLASNEHEIDFVTPDKDFIEVKRGRPVQWTSAGFPGFSRATT